MSCFGRSGKRRLVHPPNSFPHTLDIFRPCRNEWVYWCIQRTKWLFHLSAIFCFLFCGCNFWSPFHVAIISTPIREKWQLGWRLNCKIYFMFSSKKWSRSDDCCSGNSSRISTNMYSGVLGIWGHLVGWYSNLVGKVAARTCGIDNDGFRNNPRW